MSARRVASGVAGLALAGFIAAVFLYVSRFWTWRLWSNDGLFGWKSLSRDGDLLRKNLREVANSAGYWEINTFDILIWGCLIFLVLSAFQWLWTKAKPGDP